MVKLAKGLVIDHRYELEELIGEGGFGVVYRARQLSTKQTVAIKFLLQDRIGNDYEAWSEKKRFLREMKAIAQIKHPNIVRLIDSGSIGEHQVYIVLEYVLGDTLHAVINREGAFGEEEGLHLMIQVIDALACAHRAGIIHRDLKPQNIMVMPGGLHRNAMVLDFGIVGLLEQARDASYVSLTTNSEIRGTPSYIAPEQLRRSALTPQSDIYAWGLVCIEVLTGKRAVSGDSSFEIALRQADDNPIPIPEEITDPAVRRVLTKAVQKPLEQRYSCAAELLTDLHLLVRKSMPVMETAVREKGSSRKALLLAIALMLVFAAVAFTVYLNDQSSRRPNTAVGAAPAASKAAGCSSHAACGPKHRCGQSGECVPLLGELCSEQEGVLEQETDVLLGAIGHFEDPSQRVRLNAMRLAVREINELGGLSGGRRLSLLLCDERGSREHASEIARFLHAEMQVAALLGPLQSSAFIDVANNVAVPAELLMISPSATSSVVEVLADEGLLWRTVDSDAHVIPAMTALLADIPGRSVLLGRQGVYGAAFLEQLAALMMERGLDKPKVQSYPEELGELAAAKTFVDGLELESVHSVAIIASAESAVIIDAIERRCAGGACRPQYVLSEAGRRPELLALLGQRPDLAERLEVVGARDQNGELFERFALRYEAAWGELPQVSKVANAYDAVYVLAFALSTQSAKTLQGRELGAAIRRTVAGERLELGPTQYMAGVKTLEKGGTVNLEGASGELDFVPGRGGVSNPVLRYRGVQEGDRWRFVATGQFVDGAWLSSSGLE
ncbi:MAG: bifunctional serine/threonine-protein kinase/ABC transporter substrate-binding protein [Myxococcota bacterium]|jgi:ABC-type branched-subunit amino acid transport system substrate-binding protein|nr:bifunctional serine/threonine-protein kinase/ABC transporter substrate-binding protein [Myxococcota bacterium]